jgi:hypothetical protein
MPWSAPMAYSPIRPKFQISNVGHGGTLSIKNFILMVKELKNPNFEAFGGLWRPMEHWPILFVIQHPAKVLIRAHF